MGRRCGRWLGPLLGALLLLGLPAGRAAAERIGFISGVVTAGGEPVEHAWVAVIPVTPFGGRAGTGIAVPTDAQGRFRVDDIYTDFVKVQVRGPVGVVSTYWPGAFTFDEARALRITSSGARADVQLPRGGSVAGRVLDARTGRPLAGARVTAHAAPGGEEVGSPELGAGTEPGSFAVADLPPVPVVLRVQPPDGSALLGQWFHGRVGPAGARRFDGAARTTGVQVRLRPGATLSGTVRDGTGAPVPGATVRLVGCRGTCPTAVSGPDGHYLLGAVAPGPGMLVRAEAPGHVGQWSVSDRDGQPARLDLGAGERRRGVDIVLARGAVLAVAVVDDRTGLPVDGVSAELASVEDPARGFPVRPVDQQDAVADGRVDPAAVTPVAVGSAAPEPGGVAGPGRLAVGPVPAGQYRLDLYPGPRNAEYLPVTLALGSGIGRDGRIGLRPGQLAEVVVRLVPRSAIVRTGAGSAPSGPGPAPAGRPGTTDRWPGLDRGVLGPVRSWPR